MSRRIIVGLSGASGAGLGLEVLRLLKNLECETLLTVTSSAEKTIEQELGASGRREISELATVEFAPDEIGASIASGSCLTDGMVVVPCSMRTLASISCGCGEGLLIRAADVCLKERRRLVLVAREAPLHAGHLEAMLKVTQLGGIVYPPVPAFYAAATSMDEVMRQMAARIVATLGIDPGPALPRWTGLK
ncbi:UbiX family flavin prenyltransferase [Roseibium sp.]|uniref:UbiX family flavin prenyltransferase n=1 Tax=Roseibium sp. TaxID=1936156 RepID=UPI003A988410